jgi:hypothetical protein
LIVSPFVPRTAFRCRFCSRPHQIEEFVGGPIVGYCVDCYYKAAVAIAEMRGMTGCGDCHTTFAELRRRGHPRLHMHPKDGIWLLLCDACHERYFPKRRDLYGATPWGARLKL